VLRLIGFLLAAMFSIGGFLFVDYTMAKRWAGSEDGEGLTVAEYLGGFAERLTGFTSASAENGLPTALIDMLPKPPEGWTVRPTVPEDADVFLPKAADDGTADASTYVKAVAAEPSGDGLEHVALTYERGERRVVFQAVRYPNLIFTSFMAMEQRFELQTLGPQFRPTDFMTVRGLDVTEDLLPKGMRARYFLANVGAQIQIRVLASSRMSDENLLPFFETLHVQAMNASVIDKQEGLGQVPVIVLASVLDEATRAAYEADRIAREEADDAARAAERAAAEAEAAAAAAAEATDGNAGEDPETNTDKGASVLKGEGRIKLQNE
jgi:hypothetical protein